MLEVRKARKTGGLETGWKTGEEVFLWWIEDKELKGQLAMEFVGTDFQRFKEKGKEK